MTDCFSSVDFSWSCELAEVEGGSLFTEQPWARWDLADIFVGGGQSLPCGLVSCLGLGVCHRYWRHSLCLLSSSPPAPKGRRDQTKLVLMRDVVESYVLLLGYCCQIPSLQGKPAQKHE